MREKALGQGGSKAESSAQQCRLVEQNSKGSNSTKQLTITASVLDYQESHKPG